MALMECESINFNRYNPSGKPRNVNPREVELWGEWQTFPKGSLKGDASLGRTILSLCSVVGVAHA